MPRAHRGLAPALPTIRRRATPGKHLRDEPRRGTDERRQRAMRRPRGSRGMSACIACWPRA